jgi:hypothetical protein
MTRTSVQYRFRQRFPAAADEAFAWCVDFRPDDLALEKQSGRRRVQRLAPDLVILTDRLDRDGARPVVKTKLVRLRPRERAWTSTHLAGPNRYSQFWYRIVPRGRSSSRLEFTGLHVEPASSSAGPGASAALAKRITREDSAAWRSFAEAMQRDFREPAGARRRRSRAPAKRR